MFGCCSRSLEPTPQTLAKEYNEIISSIGANIHAIGEVFKSRISSDDWVRPIECGVELSEIKSSIARAVQIVDLAQKIKAKTKIVTPVSKFRAYTFELLEGSTKATAIAGFIFNQATADPEQRFQGNTATYVAGAALLFAVGVSELNKCLLRRRATHLEVSNALDQITGVTAVAALSNQIAIAAILEHRLLARKKIVDGCLSSGGVEEVMSDLLEKLDQIPVGTPSGEVSLQASRIEQEDGGGVGGISVGVARESSSGSSPQPSPSRNNTFWQAVRAAGHSRRRSGSIPQSDSAAGSISHVNSSFGREGVLEAPPLRIVVDLPNEET